MVTGATAGIGLETAKLFASQGWNLYITGRRMARLEELAGELHKAHGSEVRPLIFDVGDREACQKQLESVGPIHCLVNNAGLALGAEPFYEGELEDWDRMIDTNVKGLLYVSRLLIPKLMEQAPSQIVNVGSVAGRYAYPGGAVYNATKFAVRAISESLRMDLLGKKVRVTNVEPGMVETEFSRVRFKDDQQKADNVYRGMTPLTANDIAETILWCVNRPEHVNVQELVIYPTEQASVYHVHRSE